MYGYKDRLPYSTEERLQSWCPGPNPTEGPNPTLPLERLWGTRKAGLNPFITLARAKDVKQDGQQ